MGDALSNNSEIPLYRQLIDLIRDKIDTGLWKSGDRIPSEAELSAQFSVSRITVRNAISELVEEGLLVKHQGKGTFVANRRILKDMRKFGNFTETCLVRGCVPSTYTVSKEVKPASISLCEKLGLPLKSEVVVIERVRLSDGLPVIYETNFFPLSYSFLLNENLNKSLYEVLNEHQVYPIDARRTIEICFATEKEAQHLQVDPQTALLLIFDQVFDNEKRIVHLCKQVIRSDRFKFML